MSTGEQLHAAEAGKDTRGGSQLPRATSTQAGMPLLDELLEQIRAAGLVLPRPRQAGQAWVPATDAERHLLSQARRLDRARRLLLGQIGWLRQEYTEQAARHAQAAPRATAPCPLTAGQLEVLAAVAVGEPVAETARRLLLPHDTIRSRRRRINARLGTRSTAQAAVLAATAGWITPGQITGGTAP
ncbi:LuxR C-terminal-related transcriptional regulator [Streptomyces sp. NPDC047070]|uniref:LuxR C-terminal-related transcriptional regulator n=1 Tax=Streptomyces sp. NPDC047070 TaxID=3154923 RepID=UPI00345498D9